MSLTFFVSLVKSACSVITAGGLTIQLTGHQMVRKNVYNLFYIFLIIIIIIYIIISFVVSLNCFYLNPRVLLFVHSPPYPTGL